LTGEEKKMYAFLCRKEKLRKEQKSQVEFAGQLITFAGLSYR
jgi:hypothetical protein